jgi:hypothetical protein
MSTAPAVTHVSWLKHFGQIIRKILGFIAKDAAPIADQAAKVAAVLLPQFAVEIAAASNLIDHIANQCIITESLVTATAGAPTGPEKLAYVLKNIGPEIDAWVASRFPGATQISLAAKAGLINAIVAIINELEPGLATSPAASPAPPPTKS